MLFGYLILLMFSAYELFFIIEHLLAFNKASRQTRQFQSKAGEAFLLGQYTTVAHFAREYPASPLAFVINAALNERGDPGEQRPVMRLRQQAIVAKTIEMKRALGHLSAVGSAFGLLVVLLVCIHAINIEPMTRGNATFFTQYVADAFTDALFLMVFCLLNGFVVLVAHKFFSGRVEQFQLEMDRLSLALIERLTSQPSAQVPTIHSYKTDMISAKKTRELAPVQDRYCS